MNFPLLICSSLAFASSSAPLKLNQRATSSHEMGFSILKSNWEKKNWFGTQLMRSLNGVWKHGGIGSVWLQGGSPTVALELPSFCLQAGLWHWGWWRLRGKIVLAFPVRCLLLWELLALKNLLQLPKDIVMSAEVWEMMVQMIHPCLYED